MTDTTEPKRPTGVLLVSILAWVIGIIEVINGLQLIFAGEVGAFWSAGFYFFVGALAILVGVQLLRADLLARRVATVVFVLVVLAWVAGLFLIDIGPAWFGGLAGAVLGVVGLVLLWTGRSAEFFRRGY
jgi:hypothetical protein